MKNIKKIRLFVISRLFGLFLITVAIYLLISILSFSQNDPSLYTGSINEINNWLGIYGSYTGSFFIIFFNYSSYLFVLFFLVTGIKSVLGIKYSNILICFFIFLIGIFSLNLSLELLAFSNSILGDFLKNMVF